MSVPQIPKGVEMMLRFVGITPELLSDPVKLLQQFGINPDDLLKKVAEFQQIGLTIQNALVENNARLARIEAALGIVNDPDHRRSATGDHGGDTGELRGVGLPPPDRRN